MRDYFEWVGVILGRWGVDRALFWVGGAGWVIILGVWEWVGKYFGWVGVGGLSGGGWGWGWVHCLIMPM